MPKRDQDYNLIAALHDQLEDIEGYEKYARDAADCPSCAKIWERLKCQAEEAVVMLRQEIQDHVGGG